MNATIKTEIQSAIARSQSHNEIVTVHVSNITEAVAEVGMIADGYGYCSAADCGGGTGTDIWGEVDGSDFRLFLRD